ncbi:4Fe-4S single cluster domain-containing protein [Paenibacillus urinalis]|uniref:4Fe-4S single cluster domain-containing protein n=1 Tax=Paenibacillus urinalis TaxID=521520 RepID=A0AAX3N0Q5_9BACL|nr:4Fe-4S single cluster domain-containing protein [Paenibacillus urinalis]WDH83330.1 4Fe-4S single cluster domain-containing protein [Paenibacillus urinalis]
MPLINMAHFIECTEVEGPGKRAALWVQGCLKRCPGCCNEQYLEIRESQIVECEFIVERLRTAKEKQGIEGVTFLGGEPMLQAKGLSYIAEACRDMGLTVMIFTGYTVEELNRLDFEGIEQLLAFTDLLVDGPFIDAKYEDERKWAGSKNQCFHFLTAAYAPGIEYEDAYNGMEIRLSRSGELQINGWPFELGGSGS